MRDTQLSNPVQCAATIDADMKALPIYHAIEGRKVRRKYSKLLKAKDVAFVLELAHILIQEDKYKYRWIPYELVQFHQLTFASLGVTELESLGRGMQGWGEVDCFSRSLSAQLG